MSAAPEWYGYGHDAALLALEADRKMADWRAEEAWRRGLRWWLFRAVIVALVVSALSVIAPR